jgi:hypothetical protein
MVGGQLLDAQLVAHQKSGVPATMLTHSSLDTHEDAPASAAAAPTAAAAAPVSTGAGAGLDWAARSFASARFTEGAGDGDDSTPHLHMVSGQGPLAQLVWHQ